MNKSFFDSRLKNFVLMKKGDAVKPEHKDKLLLVSIEGMNTSREDRLDFLNNKYVFFYEQEDRNEDLLESALLPMNRAIESINSKVFCYYPKDEESEKLFTSMPGVNFVKFSNIESLIVSCYYLKVSKVYESFLFLQMINAFPNVDFFEVMEKLNLEQRIYIDTEPCKKLWESAQRRDEVKNFSPLIDYIDNFSLSLAQKFEKYKSVGIIGVTEFSEKVARYLDKRMYVDIYDPDVPLTELKKISGSASGSLNYVLKNCNSFLLSKDLGITEEQIGEKLIFDVCGAFPIQRQKIKALGRKGWVFW